MDEGGEDVFPSGSSEAAQAEAPPASASAASASASASAAPEEAVEENPQDILDGCLERFASADFIMEPEIFTQLKTYFQGIRYKLFHLVYRHF